MTGTAQRGQVYVGDAANRVVVQGEHPLDMQADAALGEISAAEITGRVGELDTEIANFHRALSQHCPRGITSAHGHRMVAAQEAPRQFVHGYLPTRSMAVHWNQGTGFRSRLFCADHVIYAMIAPYKRTFLRECPRVLDGILAEHAPLLPAELRRESLPQRYVGGARNGVFDGPGREWCARDKVDESADARVGQLRTLTPMVGSGYVRRVFSPRSLELE
jgi:hypothetical protein